MVHVFDKTPKNDQLLPVLLAQHQTLRLHQRQKTGHNGGNTIEMPRAHTPTEIGLQQGWNRQAKTVFRAVREDVTDVGSPDGVDSCGLRKGKIRLQSPRITVVVLVRTELQWVDEQTEEG